MNAGYSSCASLHGGIDQYDRDSTIVDFKNGKTQILVATSVCARGLDVKKLVLVVNYDCPNHYEDYVHRDSTIVDFKNGKTQILVATSVCARGLDVKKLVLVVNY